MRIAYIYTWSVLLILGWWDIDSGRAKESAHRQDFIVICYTFLLVIDISYRTDEYNFYIS